MSTDRMTDLDALPALLTDAELCAAWNGARSNHEKMRAIESAARAPLLAALSQAIAQRDAAFAMSRCECSSSEACANLVAKDAQVAQLQAENRRLSEALAEFVAALDEKRSASENLMQSVETAERNFAASERVWANLESSREALAAGGAQTKGAR